jgi:hypothetical protein
MIQKEAQRIVKLYFDDEGEEETGFKVNLIVISLKISLKKITPTSKISKGRVAWYFT